MLTVVLLLPSSAFGEVPQGCAAGVANIAGVLAINPSAKTTIDIPVGIEWKVTNSVGDDDDIACDAAVQNSDLFVNGFEITPSADCPYNQANFDVAFSNDQEVDIHPALMGACSNVNFLFVGFNNVLAEAQGFQTNVFGDNALEAPWTVSVSTAKPVYDRCILVEKDGLPKVRLDDGQATVTYDVTVTNCGEGVLVSNLDNCLIDDTVAGPVIQDLGVIAPGFPL
jgi:hypothetical protein